MPLLCREFSGLRRNNSVRALFDPSSRDCGTSAAPTEQYSHQMPTPTREDCRPVVAVADESDESVRLYYVSTQRITYPFI